MAVVIISTTLMDYIGMFYECLLRNLAVFELADGCGQSGRLKKAKKEVPNKRIFTPNKGGSVIGSEGEPI